MKIRKRVLVLLIMCMVLGITGCSANTSEQTMEPVEGLEQLGGIQAVAREEGSGTRNAFAQLLEFETENPEEQKTDLTRTDARIEQNAESVITAVKEDPAAIGYVSRGALGEEKGVKILSVNGKGVDENSGKYPLSRSFYLAYGGKLTELKQDFLIYVHGAGQEIVAKTYEPVGKSSTFLSNKPAGTIRISGSTSVAPLMEELAKDYQEKNPNAKIQITQSDSTDGLTQAMTGKCDFGMSSRELKDYEKELLDYELIANDNIAVIVNPNNPMENITMDLLKKIYTGKLNKWTEINEQ